MSHFTYLAIPYTGMEEESYKVSLKAVAIYSKNSVPCYSPIVHMHPVAIKYDMPGDYKFWRLHAETMIRACGAVHVLMPKTFGRRLIERSKGVRMECRFGHGLGKHIHVIALDGDKSKIHEDEAEILHALLYGT